MRRGVLIFSWFVGTWLAIYGALECIRNGLNVRDLAMLVASVIVFVVAGELVKR